jgi:capsular polysaccharide transport system permease protein
LQRILFLVVLPTVLSAIYFGFIATNEYESECVFVVERRSTDTPGLEAPTQTGSGTRHESGSARDIGKDSSSNVAREDALLAKDFILSREMLDVLDRRLKLLAHYRDGRIDWLSRLPVSSSRESAHDYYLKRLSVNHDPTASTLTVRFRAFEGPLARRALETILETTEGRLNALGARALKDRLELAERELARARALSSEFEAAPPSPQQLAAARPKGATATSEADFDPRNKARLMLLEERAEHLVRAEERVQHLQDELKGQSRYVALVAGPSAPDEARYPRRGRAVLTTFLLSIVGMGILSLLFSAIREHTNL